MERPIIRHGSTTVMMNGEEVTIRIMLIKYDYGIETYYQMPGYPFVFAYGVAMFEGFNECMKMAVRNAEDWCME